MYDAPAKFTATAAATLASGAISVISEETLIPLGVFVGFASALLYGTWKVATAVNRASMMLTNMDERITKLEAKIKELKENVQ